MSSQILKHMGWNVFGNLSAKLVAPIFQIIVARLLVPADYGVFGVAMAIFAFFEIIKEAGLTQAIIVNQGGEKDIRLQFTVQVFLSIIFYILIIIITPYIASFYDIPELKKVMPILGVTLFLNSFIDPAMTYYLREQEFRIVAIRQMIAPIFGSLVSLYFASQGYGVYALVYGTVTGYFGVVVFFMYKKSFKYRLFWDYGSFLKLFNLAREIIIQKLSGYLVGQADSLVIGKYLSISDLGIYRMGQKLVNLLPLAIVFQIQQVVFSDLAKAQYNDSYYNRRYNQFIVYVGGLMLLYTMSVYFIAPIAVPLILGENWIEIIPILQIISASMVTGYLSGLNNEVSKLLGFARTYSVYAVIRSLITILSVVVAVQFSLQHLIVTWVVVSMSANVINEIIFYSSQTVIQVNKSKIIIYVFAWAWLSFSLYEYWLY